MADLNDFGAQPVNYSPQQVPPPNQTDSHANLQKMGAIPISYQPKQQYNTPTIGQQAAGIGAAVVGGASNAGAGAVSAANQAATWIMSKIPGLITAKDMQDERASVEQFLDKNFRARASGDASDVFNKAQIEHPNISTAAELATGAGLVGKLSGIGAGTTGAAGIAARAGINAATGAGLAPAGQEARGAEIGTGASLAGDAIAAGISKLGAAGLSLGAASKAIKNWRANTPEMDPLRDIKQQALQSETIATAQALQRSNQLWDSVKNIPGTINGGAVKNNVQNYISNQNINLGTLGIKNALNESQQAILTGFQNKAVAMQNMDDAIRLKQSMSKQYAAFAGKGIPDSITDGYKDLQSTVDAAIRTKADQEGKLQDYLDANEFHRNYIVPIQAANADDRLQAVTEMNRIQQYNQGVQQKNQQMQADAVNKYKADSQQAQQQGLPAPPMPQQGAPQLPQAPIPQQYTKAIETILPSKVTPDTINASLSRMDANGRNVMENYFVHRVFQNLNPDAPDQFDFNSATKKINDIAKEYKGVISPQAIDKLQGMKNALLETRSAYQEQAGHSSAYFQHSLGHVVGSAAVGGFAGNELGGHEGAATGALAGALGVGIMPKIMQGMSSLVQTPIGQTILRKMADRGVARQVLQTVIKGAGPTVGTQNTNQGE